MNPLTQDLEHVLEHASGLWQDLRNARLFLTGGTGFFGCWLLESFLAANDHHALHASIVVLTRSRSSFEKKAPHLAKHPAVTLHEGDVRSFQYPDGRFTHVIHAATDASASLNRDSPLQMLDTIVLGTRRALEFAVASGAERFLFTSSGAVYGRQPSDISRLSELFYGGPEPAESLSAYGEGKRVAELLCALFADKHALHCVIGRYFAFVGPYLPLDTHFAIGNFIRDCIASRPIEIRGDGTPMRSYLYAADLAIWTWTLLLRGQSCRPYNVGSENALSIRELAHQVASALGVAPQVCVLGEARMGAPLEQYVPSTHRARSELGLREWIPLDVAIRRTADWHTAKARA